MCCSFFCKPEVADYSLHADYRVQILARGPFNRQWNRQGAILIGLVLAYDIILSYLEVFGRDARKRTVEQLHQNM